MKNQGILIKIINEKGFYQEFNSRKQALSYIVGYSGYLDKIKQHYYSHIDGKFMKNQWLKDYGDIEILGNVALTHNKAINAPEGLDDESLAKLLWEQALGAEPHDYNIIVEHTSSQQPISKKNLKLPPTDYITLASDVGCLAVQSPDFKKYIKTNIIKISLKFGGDDLNSLIFAEDMEVEDYWNYGFEELVQKIQINKLFKLDCPDRDTGFLNLGGATFNIWGNPDSRVVLLKRIDFE